MTDEMTHRPNESISRRMPRLPETPKWPAKIPQIFPFSFKLPIYPSYLVYSAKFTLECIYRSHRIVWETMKKIHVIFMIILCCMKLWCICFHYIREKSVYFCYLINRLINTMYEHLWNCNPTLTTRAVSTLFKFRLSSFFLL